MSLFCAEYCISREMFYVIKKRGSWRARPRLFSRAFASHVAWGETSDGAIAVVAKGIKAHGVSQRLLTYNGAALNPSRRGMVGQFVTCVTALGVEAIFGKSYKPTTQGRNERFHQTLFRVLDKRPSHRVSRSCWARSISSMRSTTPSDPVRDCPDGSPAAGLGGDAEGRPA